jgi:teichuronic acid biosynthesis glycosyltransferase TuaH
MKTVLIPPIVDWSILKQLPQQIAEQFSKNNYNVIFCNATQNNIVHRINENLIVTGNFREVLEDIGRGKIKIDIFYNTWAKHYDLIEKIKPKITIYHSCDSFEEWKKYENNMIKCSDIVLCTSQYIYDMRIQEHNNVYLCRNACDSSMINQPYQEIPEIVEYDGCKFTFIGAIGVWVSTYLIRKIANKYPTFFIGKEFGKPNPSNVINLGLQSHNKLINYYKSSDVGLLPFNIKSEITLAANPIKLWENLACGIPVLATKWDETTLDELKGVVFAAKDDMEYVELADYLANLSDIDKNNIKEKAIKTAKNNTWENRFEIIKGLIE